MKHSKSYQEGSERSSKETGASFHTDTELLHPLPQMQNAQEQCQLHHALISLYSLLLLLPINMTQCAWICVKGKTILQYFCRFGAKHGPKPKCTQEFLSPIDGTKLTPGQALRVRLGLRFSL